VELSFHSKPRLTAGCGAEMTSREEPQQPSDDDAGKQSRAGAADARDRAAEDRDVAAELRDKNALVRDESWTLQDSFAMLQRSAAADRAAAEGDRMRSAENRAASAVDRSLSSFDELTGVYRRTSGMIEARRELARSRRLGQSLTLVFVDVDGLKALNDTSGHAAGDHLLSAVGREIRQALRAYDVTLRYGGDEFVCVLANVDAAEAAARFGRVNAALAAGYIPGSVSVGVAEAKEGETLDDLVGRADEVMYLGRKQRRSPQR